MKNVLINEVYSGERALFGRRDLSIHEGYFRDGESPLKECRDIDVHNSIFGWKYPLWYCENIVTVGTNWLKMARAGVWYTNHISVKDALIEAPKNFRRCNDVTVENAAFTDAAETFWNCSDVKLRNVSAKGTYFGMNMKGGVLEHCHIDGDYGFDGASDLVIKDCTLLTKDAFWNCSNIVIENSTIIGEYFGWNSKNVTLRGCTIQSLQGFCYIENLKMEDCKLLDTTLAFEYSAVDAQISTGIKSVLNPKSGRITAESIDDLIVEKDRVNPGATEIKAAVGRRIDDARIVLDTL